MKMKEKSFSMILASIFLLLLFIISSTESAAAITNASSAAEYAYIACGNITNENSGNGIVYVIDTATDAIKATINVGIGPFGVAVSPDGTRVYVMNGWTTTFFGANDFTVSVIDTAINTVIATIPIGEFPQGIAVSPDGTRVYVTSGLNQAVYVIDTTTNTVIATVPVGKNPQGIAITPDGKRVYVVNYGSDTVYVIDTATNNVILSVKVGEFPQGVAVSPDGTRVYVTNILSNTVSVIDTATHSIIATINVGISPFGVAVSPDGTRVYVTNIAESTVSVIDTAINNVTTTVPVGLHPQGISVTSDGAKVYVANEDSNTFSVIDTSTNTVINTVTVGNNPVSFGQFIVTNPSSMLDTTTILTSSANQYGFRQPITLTATVNAMSKGKEMPSGTVTFLDGHTSIGTEHVIYGLATLTISSLSIGTHLITAKYNGDSDFKPDISSTLTIIVLNSIPEPQLTPTPISSQVIINGGNFTNSNIYNSNVNNTRDLRAIPKQLSWIFDNLTEIFVGLVASVGAGIILMFIEGKVKKYLPKP